MSYIFFLDNTIPSLTQSLVMSSLNAKKEPQSCIHPDTQLQVAAGKTYSYSTIAVGTTAECAASLKTATCDSMTGIFFPDVSTVRFRSCTISNTKIQSGTVYTMTTLGSLPSACTKAQFDAAWNKELRPIIAYYHKDKEKIKINLEAMRRNGQIKMGLMIWNVPSDAPADSYGIFSGNNIVPDSPGKLKLQHLLNLKAYLQLLDSLDFNEFQIRWGFYTPPFWNNWDEARDQAKDDSKYLEDSNVIFSTIQEIQNFMAEKKLKIKVMWDLGGELPKNSPATRKYMKRLWTDYSNKGLSLDNTYGFSIAFGEQLFRQYLDDLKSTGKPLPKFYSFDIYPNPSSEISIFSTMSIIKEILSDYDELGKGIILQESYYNNAAVAADLVRSRNELGLNIIANMQWPASREYEMNHFGSATVPEGLAALSYSEESPILQGGQSSAFTYPICAPLKIIPALAKVPEITNAGVGCSDNYCFWIQGKNIPDDAIVQVLNRNSGVNLAEYAFSKVLDQKTGIVSGSGRFGHKAVKAQLDSGGVNIRIYVPRGPVISNEVVVQRP